MNERKYRIILSWSKEDNAWIAEVPELLGCAADGATPTEAVTNVQAAIDRWLAIAREEGWQIPEPQPYTTPASA
jgi:predicted RNase H-like HicB family nuclease